MPHHHHHQRKSQFTASVKNQFLAIGCANIVTLSHGCILGWLSPFLPLLKSADSPLESGAVTVEQASWIGAIICAGGLLGNAVFGVLVNRLGCKRSIAWLALPQLVIFFRVGSASAKPGNNQGVEFYVAVILVDRAVWHECLALVRGSNMRRNDGRWSLHLHSAVCGRNSGRSVSQQHKVF